MIAQRLLVALLALNLSPIRAFTAAPTSTTTSRRRPRSSSYSTTAIAPLHATKTATKTATKKSKSKSKTTRRTSSKWDRMIAQLTRYHQQQGHALVPVEHNAELAEWCKTIRRNYSHQLLVVDNQETTSTRRPTLSTEKMQHLQNLEFVWNVQTHIWNQRFAELCRFRATHSHCQVPLSDNQSLAMWVHNQNCQYRLVLQGRSSSLSPERMQALASIGFWETFVSREDSWNTRLMELQDFYDTYGHANVPEDYADHYALGQWVMNQRLHYKRFVAGLTPCPLTPDRIAALEALDFRWNVHSYQWFVMLERLRTFAEENGHVRIIASLQKDADDNSSLRDLNLWLIQQRHAYQRKLQGRSSSMTDTRQAALEQIPEFAWKTTGSSQAGGGPSKDDWQELFQGLREKGIAPGVRPKEHWFDGQNPFSGAQDEKEIYDDDDLLDLWNQEGDEEDAEEAEEEFSFDLSGE